MADSTSTASGRIFMSYRREETSYATGWLFDRLTEKFGGGQVFKDVDSIELGDDFVERISAAVGSCDVLLALIGEEWLTMTDARGRRRLDQPDDFVRVEIEAALARQVRVIPILVDGAAMPSADELPPSMAKLVRRQALELSPSRFDFDTSRLMTVLERTLAEVRRTSDDVVSPGASTVTAASPSQIGPSPEPGRPTNGATEPGALETDTRASQSASTATRAEVSGGVDERSERSEPRIHGRLIGIPAVVLFVIGLVLPTESDAGASLVFVGLLGLLWIAVEAVRLYFFRRRRR
jgi:hypothetical protein